MFKPPSSDYGNSSLPIAIFKMRVCSCWVAIEMLIFPLSPVDSYSMLLHSSRHVRLSSEKKGRKDS